MEQQFSLRWNNYLNQITDAFDSLRSEEDLVDVTLSCEGNKLKAHKMLLSACSTYFRDIFKENPCQHPVIVFRNVKYADLEAIIEFMYKGEVSVIQEQLESFLSTAELLEVKGLTDGPGKDSSLEEDEQNAMPKIQQEDMPELTRPNRSVAPRRQPPVLFHAATNRPASPPIKKRKYSSSAQDKPPERKQSSEASEVSSAPILLKVEQEYIEDLTFDEDEDVDLDRPTSTEPSHSLLNPKPDSSMEFNTMSNSSQEQKDACLRAMGQMLLAEPGTSEGVNQESMQVEDIDEPEEKEEDNKDDESVGQKTESGEEQPNEVEPETKAVSPKPSEANRATPVEEATVVTESEDKSIDIEREKKIKSLIARVKKPEARKMIPKAKDSSTPVSKGVHLPKGLTVTVRSVTRQVPGAPNSSTLDHQTIHSTEDYPSLRSEEAKTPIHEELNSYQEFPEQEDLQGVTSSVGQILQDEPEMAEEAPVLGSEQETADVPEEEEKEPEFDYYGCVLCKAEMKPVDRFNFTHKCPICPCVCFCSHLLKEHMRFMHGWFNVQRRFNQY